MDEGTPNATVVITTRNRASETCHAVESALRQSVPVETIVIDGASDDRTPEEIEQRFREPPALPGECLRVH